MSILARILKSALYKIVFIFIILSSLIVFLLTTTPGFYLCLKLTEVFLPGKLTVSKVQGRLIDQAFLGSFDYQDNKIHLNIKNFSLSWPLTQLLHQQLIIEDVQAQAVDITYQHLPTNALSTPADQAKNLPLPVSVTVNNLHINQLTIRYNNSQQLFTQLHSKLQLYKDQWQIAQFDFNYAQNRFYFTGHGQLSSPFALTASLELKPFNHPLPSLTGKLTLKGDSTLYQWQGEFNGPAQVNLKGTLQQGKELHTYLAWHKLIWPLSHSLNLASSEGQIKIDGNIPTLNMTLNAAIDSPWPATIAMTVHNKANGLQALSHIKAQEAVINLMLNYRPAIFPQIQGELSAHALELVNNPLPLKNLQAKANFKGNQWDELSINSEIKASYYAEVLKADLHYEPTHFQSLMTLGTNRLILSGSSLTAWHLNANLPAPNLLHSSLQGLTTTITAQGGLVNPHKGLLTLIIKPGSYKVPDLNPLLFSGGQLNLQLDKKQLIGQGKLILDKDKSAELALKLPEFHINKWSTEKQKLSAKLAVNINSLAFLDELSPSLANSKGQLNATLTALGTVARPLIEGQIILRHGGVSIPEMGLDLYPISLKLLSRNQHWDLNGTASSQGHRLNLKGQGQFTPQVTGAIHIEGNNFPFIHTDEYNINLSPQLELDFNQTPMTLKGNILVPQAAIKPQNFINSVSLSEDARFVGEASRAPSLPLYTNLRIQMGKQVEIAIKGLQGFLDGAVHIEQKPTGSMIASGELTVRQGKYKAYGQDLEINEGALLFTGGLVDNPGIRIRASREFNNSNRAFSGSNRLLDFNNSNLQTMDYGNKTVVGVEVNGRINSPKIQLFSNPANLSQADILSMLLLGRPANQANQAGGQLLLTAISSLNLDASPSGNQLLEQVKKNLGFDFDLASNSEYNQQTNTTKENTSVMVGKSLSERLYLSYNLGLSQNGNNILTLKYLLNKFFSIQVNASTIGSGVDLLYTHQKE